MFCEESLSKIKFWAFPKRVDLRILSLQSIDYFGEVNTTESLKKKKKRIIISKTAMVGCCNFSGIEAREFLCIYTRV